MIELLVILVTGLLMIAGATTLGPRIGIASPLLLVALGVAASVLPVFATFRIEPELVLAGVLPPLLFSSAVSMPAMNFRREFGAVSGLSVLLVVASALLLGVFFQLAIPGLGFPWGVALGAIISPTDAVAASIVKQTPVSRRVIAILDGECLLNDATALVLLRTAIVAAATSFSFWNALGTFAYSVVVALVIGLLVGWLNLAVRRRAPDPTVNTVISFAAPFAASIPAAAIGASGLVAAVVAGLVTGYRAPRELSPRNRLSDSQNWRTVELVLEGAVFLTMGLQITSIIGDVRDDRAGVGSALLIAACALVLTVAVRAGYVAPLLRVLAVRARYAERMRPRLQSMRERDVSESFAEMTRRRRPASQRTLDQFARRVTQGLADIDYFLRQPLGWRDGTAVVWAGMRGAVTVAAVQTLPDDTPQRPLLVLIAFAVAAYSLLVQGGTIGPLLRRISRPDTPARYEHTETERRHLRELLRSSVPAPDDATATHVDPAPEHTLATLAAQRTALLDARDNGVFDADVLADALADLDASEIAITLRTKTWAGPDPRESTGR